MHLIKITIDTDDNEYPFAQGYENFINKLLAYFPNEEKGLRLYCEKIKDVCSKFPLYNLRSAGEYNEKASILELNAKEVIESVTDDKKLQVIPGGEQCIVCWSTR